jgi:5-methylcytosine-specific restriction endonuclease McrA
LNLSPTQRQTVLNKSGGRCWYCGKVLKKIWHVDHLKPIRRITYYNRHEKKRKPTGRLRCPENDVFSNLVPSCPVCNKWKSDMTIEDFRKSLTQLVRSVQNHTNVRMAMLYGIVEVREFVVKFWFEKHINEKIHGEGEI